MPSTPDAQLKAMLANLPDKTGRPLEEWLAFLDPHQGEKHGVLVNTLKAEGITHGYANLIVQIFRSGGVPPGASPGEDDGSALVDAQFEGKEGLRPIYARVIDAVMKLGSDVEIAPKKTYVSLRRKKQFGLVQPSTRTRVDLGLNLRGEAPPDDRLEPSGSFNAMVSHRVRLEKPEDVDAAVSRWLKQAYDEA